MAREKGVKLGYFAILELKCLVGSVNRAHDSCCEFKPHQFWAKILLKKKTTTKT